MIRCDPGTRALFSLLLSNVAAPHVVEVGVRRQDMKTPTIHRSVVPHAASYIGVDVEAGMDVDVVANAEELSRHFAAGSLDAVVCIATLEHIKRPWLAIQEFSTVLKAGGLAFIETHQTFPLHYFPSDYFRFTAEAIEVMCGDAGMEIVRSAYLYPVRIDPYENPELRWGEQPPAFLNISAIARKKP